MTMEEKTRTLGQPTPIECQNSLVTKIALFLNYLNKENYQRLARDMNNTRITSEGEVLKLMMAKRYVHPQDISGLKKTCLSFARAQEDTRFGSLCIQFDFLTQSNLNLALEEQKVLAASGNNLFLGDLLVDAGMISERQRKLILQKQKNDNGFRKTGTPPPSPSTLMGQSGVKEIREMAITIRISGDALSAHMIKTDKFKKPFSLENLTNLIEKNGIIYGVAPVERLQEFLDNDAYTQKFFELARGLDPLDGTDAQIFYMFEQEHLKAGMISRDGSIDFKSRGDIPFAMAGEILAEKIPSKDGKSGVNVFGDVVPPAKPLEVKLNCGNGVKLSPDKLQAIAQVSGYPKLTQTGEVILNDAYIIKGNVDYTTGHIKFDKNIFITGTIKDGFKVEGIDVVARSVDGGIIRAKGNVCVENGVTDASIIAKGSISAGFIHRSTISCMGDVDVRKEVVETEMVMEGTFKMLKGKMYASTLSARGGAKIWQVGSEKSSPSVIAVGTSSYLKNELKSLNQFIEKNQAYFETKTFEKNKTDQEMTEANRQLELLKQSRKDLLAQSTQGAKTLQESPEKEDLATRLDSIGQEITSIYALRALLEQKKEMFEREAAYFSNAVKQGVAEKFNLKRHNQANPPKPILDVSGKLLSGTRINGRYAKTVVKNEIARVRIMEMSCSSGDGSKRDWEMITTRL
ncbi:MAG: FapA family protein [Proteobacteria bacterium]|nr:FapA family protein [Pseudomonadota bacterium]